MMKTRGRSRKERERDERPNREKPRHRSLDVHCGAQGRWQQCYPRKYAKAELLDEIDEGASGGGRVHALSESCEVISKDEALKESQTFDVTTFKDKHRCVPRKCDDSPDENSAEPRDFLQCLL